MTVSRLYDLYNSAMRREKRPQAVPEETEDQRNRRTLLAAIQQQKTEDTRKTGLHTHYVTE